MCHSRCLACSRRAFGCMARHGSSHAWRTSRYAALPPRGLAGPNRSRRSLADGKARRGSIRLAWRTRLPSVQTAFSAAFSHADAYHTGYLGVEGVEVRRPTFPLGWAGLARPGRAECAVSTLKYPASTYPTSTEYPSCSRRLPAHTLLVPSAP